MKYTKNTTEVYNLQLEPTDEYYQRCMWATVNIDTQNCVLSVVSDVGNYAYSWKPTPNSENFKKLLCRFDKEYLLDKLASRTEFNFEETIKEMIQQVNDDEYYSGCGTCGSLEKAKEEIIEELNDIENCGEDCVYRDISNITSYDNVCAFDFENINMVMEYSPQAVNFIEVFFKHLMPILREKINILEDKK